MQAEDHTSSTQINRLVIKTKRPTTTDNSSKSQEMVPSFSLGLTQAQKEIQSEREKEDGRQNELEKHLQDKQLIEDKGKRKVQASEVLKSPWRIRPTKITTKLTREEHKLQDWMETLSEDSATFYFKTGGIELDGGNIRTLLPNCQTTIQVINVFCHILNKNEIFKSEASPLRFFVLHQVTVYNMRYKDLKEEEAKFRRFTEEMELYMANYEHINFNKIDVIMFAMTVSEHHYILCFNIKKPAFEVIDNSALEPNFTAKYQEIPFNIQNFLVKLMTLKNHPKANDVASLTPVRLEMKWRTEDNHRDCTIFVMRHLEHYLGVAKGWDCGFNIESRQKEQLDVMRIKYAEKILKHDANEKRQNVEFGIFEVGMVAQEQMRRAEKSRKKEQQPLKEGEEKKRQKRLR